MRARDFLLEYDATTTARNFAEELYSRAYGWIPNKDDQNEPDYNWIDRNGIRLLDLVHYKRMSYDGGEKIIEWFEHNDPSGGKFILPMIRWYLQGMDGMRSLEDAPKLKGPIATYIKFKNRIKGVDLRKISFDDFLTAMEAQQDKMSGAEADKAEEQSYYDRGDAVLIHDDSQLKIVWLKTMGASCYFGRNTRWCTTSRDKNDNMFNAYARNGPLFVILDKELNRRYQYHWDCAPIMHLRSRDHQFMDEKDQPVYPLNVMHGIPFEIIWDWAIEQDLEPLLDEMRETVAEWADTTNPEDYERWCAYVGIEYDHPLDDDDEEDDPDAFDYDAFHDPRQHKLDL